MSDIREAAPAPVTRPALTRLHLDALRIICEWVLVYGVAPSCEELATEMGFASKANALRVLTLLEERGAIRRQRARARAITILWWPPRVEEAAFILTPAGARALAEQVP